MLTPPPVPLIARMPLSDLHIDHTYHTTINEEALVSLCQEVEPMALGLIVVNRRADGRYWVIDGATRVLGLRYHGATHIAAEVREGLTLAEERRGYEIMNTTFPKHPMDLYKATLVAEGITS